MKEIQPVGIWNNGEVKTASVLNARIINDDLKSSCTFYWELMSPDSSGQPYTGGVQLSNGNSSMSGEDYQNWDGSNDSAYEYIAEKINVVIVGDVTTTTSTSTSTTTEAIVEEVIVEETVVETTTINDKP